jgi:hypothetical protein
MSSPCNDCGGRERLSSRRPVTDGHSVASTPALGIDANFGEPPNERDGNFSEPRFRFDSTTVRTQVENTGPNAEVKASGTSVKRFPKAGVADDPLEREADRIADQVLRAPDQIHPLSFAPRKISRKCAGCEEEDNDARRLQMKPVSALGPHASETLGGVKSILRSPGQPLDGATRAFFEPRFAQSFSHVRVHADTEAATSASAMNAFAYTFGRDIVFAAARYSPGTSEGRKLLAHELAHVAQQQSQRSGAAGAGVTARDGSEEREARGAADAALKGSVERPLTHSPLAIARQDQDAGPSDASLPGGVTTPPAVVTDSAKPTPTTRSTKICSKRLDSKLGAFGINHSYIDDTGKGNCLGASMPGNYAVQNLVSGNFVNGCAGKTATSTDPQSYKPNVKPCNPAPGVTDVSKCLLDAYNSYPDPSLYRNLPLENGPNSNTFAATLAKKCCADSTSSGLGTVPGWNHEPAPPCNPTGPAPAPGVTPPSPPPPGATAGTGTGGG